MDIPATASETTWNRHSTSPRLSPGRADAPLRPRAGPPRPRPHTPRSTRTPFARPPYTKEPRWGTDGEGAGPLPRAPRDPPLGWPGSASLPLRSRPSQSRASRVRPRRASGLGPPLTPLGILIRPSGSILLPLPLNSLLHYKTGVAENFPLPPF